MRKPCNWLGGKKQRPERRWERNTPPGLLTNPELPPIPSEDGGDHTPHGIPAAANQLYTVTGRLCSKASGSDVLKPSMFLEAKEKGGARVGTHVVFNGWVEEERQINFPFLLHYKHPLPSWWPLLRQLLPLLFRRSGLSGSINRGVTSPSLGQIKGAAQREQPEPLSRQLESQCEWMNTQGLMTLGGPSVPRCLE